MASENSPKVIHVARRQSGKEKVYLFLKQYTSNEYVWHEQKGKEDLKTSISGINIATALRAARQHWAKDSFRTVNCGFRYTLPERDEHGSNALFHQMAASYKNPNGVYFDEELNHPCFVNFASDEALSLLKQYSA